jgi:TM2 domain-containing membrane protein YozV
MEIDTKISPKLRLPTFLFAFFLGVLGIHRFYVGKTGSAIVMLILSLTVVGLLITSVWNLIDWICILSGTFRDADGLKIVKWTN